MRFPGLLEAIRHSLLMFSAFYIRHVSKPCSWGSFVFFLIMNHVHQSVGLVHCLNLILELGYNFHFGRLEHMIVFTVCVVDMLSLSSCASS